MSRREKYDDSFYGGSDENIRRILNDAENGGRMKKILLNIIKNDLTPRQKDVIVLYYFKGMNIVEIAELKNVSPQAVSAMIIRARSRIRKYIKYSFYN